MRSGTPSLCQLQLLFRDGSAFLLDAEQCSGPQTGERRGSSSAAANISGAVAARRGGEEAICPED